MAANTEFVKDIRKMGSKTWSGILYIWHRPLLLSTILLALAVFLTYLLVTQTFKDYFNCAFLIGSKGPLNMDQLCNGVSIYIDTPVYKNSFPILPALNAIDRPLEGFRKFIVWDIIIFFALVSLVLAFIVNKITGFVKFVRTPAGRKIVLTNLSTWLFIFVILSTLFYLSVVL
ncbi:MAG: hypothetical protein WCC12_08760 [Anaerolineales bacterium]